MEKFSFENSDNIQNLGEMNSKNDVDKKEDFKDFQDSQSRALNRLQKTSQHIIGSSLQVEDCSQTKEQSAAIQKLDLLLNDANVQGTTHHQGKEKVKWNGWGYDDTEFKLNSDGNIYLTGKRYSLSGVAFPKLRGFAEKVLSIDIKLTNPPNPNLPQMPKPILQDSFMDAIKGQYFKISTEEKDRLFHSHGHTCDDIFKLRYASFDRYVDVVIWPGKHEHIEKIVQMAHKFNVVIIPFGGGTSVATALECPATEKRCVVSLDMHEMNRIKWIDYESNMACIEAGIVGKDLDSKLAKLGLCMGHEPDSSEFSTLGGWIATRASGMKKSVYGNIEDIIISAKMVTPIGTLEKSYNVPRISNGPEITQVMLGSEGTLGVITEAVVRIRPLPEVRRYGSVVFPDFESGVSCLKELASKRIFPASIRLMDNMQFQLGQVLKPESHSIAEEYLDMAKKWYVTKYKGFQIDKMVAATLLFEGNPEDIELQEKRVYTIAARYGGMKGGEENGKRGYFLTYMIAYIRDFAFNYWVLSESFETSVPWAKVSKLCSSVKEAVTQKCKDSGIQAAPFVTCRVTQSYETGACVYFYFAFMYRGLKDPLKVYMDIEDFARDEILKVGGSLSHHHGIGKLRKKWMPEVISNQGISLIQGMKKTLDPNNIFANGNLV